ncbi:MAG: Glu-tRNA(Gln) amidotransferase subunit GatD [Candidatus Bathyarchaeia archaeon]
MELTAEFPGYRGEALRVLQKAGAEIEDYVRIKKDKVTYEGILIPRSEYGDDKHLVIKLSSGYNIGIRITPTTKIEKIGSKRRLTFNPPPPPEQKPGLPRVAILSTGGTIASRVDYRTGAVRPAISADDLYSIIPELSDIALIDAEILFSLFSEDLTPQHWTKIAEAVAQRIRSGVDGVVTTHGTDTMGYTAAALSFALQNLPVPVILVGAQRSEDRPSSDAAMNLIGAVLAAAKAPFAEVALAMHETISDSSIVLHRGTKVRKCHTSRRDAFKSVNTNPIARIMDGQVTMLTRDYRRRDPSRELILKSKFDGRAALINFYPGMNPKIIDWYVDERYRGIILNGTGLGHVSRRLFQSVRKAAEEGIIVAMTSQCIWGRVNMNVYENGRDLLALGVIPLEDMLPETALVKLMWVLGQTDDVEEAKRLLRSSIAHEISERTIKIG